MNEKPQIYSVKLGYNPNSSSIGIWVKIFVYHTLVISLLFSTLQVLLLFKKKKPVADEQIDPV